MSTSRGKAAKPKVTDADRSLRIARPHTPSWASGGRLGIVAADLGSAEVLVTRIAHTVTYRS
jgi:hypothetical protein